LPRPPWGFSIKHGATTIWERWDGWTPERGFQSVNMNSFNHYAYGAVGEWLYARVAGIDHDETAPGFRRIVMRPLPSRAVGSARAEYRSHVGTIASAWKYQGDDVEWRVATPANCSARVTLPAPHGDVLLDGKPLPAPVEKGASAVTFDLGSGDDTMTWRSPA
jgi:alpha-L-rhamnosidase